MKNSTYDRMFAAMLGAAAIVALGWLGTEDIKNEQRYCHDVFGPNAIYPDYKGVGRKACKEVLP